MKKLVALAVAGAFIAPVYAAEISISGEVEFLYTTVNAVGAAASTATLSQAAADLDVKAVETVNGITFTGVVRQDGAGSDGATLTMAFPNGFKLGLGEQHGALDQVGDYSDIAPQLGGDFSGADGEDHGVLLVLPSVAGVTAYVSHSPKNGGATGISDADSYAVKYNFPNGEVYYGVENRGGAAPLDISAYGVKYSISGVTIGYETGNIKSPTVTTQELDGLSLGYKMGDIVLGMERNKIQSQGSAPSTENTVVFAEYNLGSSVDIYVINESSSVASKADEFAVGVEFSF